MRLRLSLHMRLFVGLHFYSEVNDTYCYSVLQIKQIFIILLFDRKLDLERDVWNFKEASAS